MNEEQQSLGESPRLDGYNATLVERIALSPVMCILRVRLDNDSFSFIPGQFTVLGLKRSAPRIQEADVEEVVLGKENRMIRRAFSITSGTQERDYLEFYISLVLSGELTPRLFYLLPGDRLFVGEGSKGVFTLEQVPGGKNILLVGTGTGLAPYVSMIRSMALGLSCPVTALGVIHGASYSWDLGFRGELEVLTVRCRRFRYLPIVSRPLVDKDWKGRTGHLQEWLARPDVEELCGMPLNPRQTHIFLCGHPGMVDAVMEILRPKGYAQGTRQAPGTLHLEKFW